MPIQGIAMVNESHDRALRAVSTCRHCLKNIAFYRAGWRRGHYRARGMFWQSANNAFFGLAISEWCKLFADSKGKQHWSQVVENGKRFEWELYKRARKAEPEFQAYVKMARRARDKTLAPLDEQDALQMPNLRSARTSTAYLHDYLLALPILRKSLTSAETQPASSVYAEWYHIACLEYQSAAARSLRESLADSRAQTSPLSGK
jgi:hypothetical protein